MEIKFAIQLVKYYLLPELDLSIASKIKVKQLATKSEERGPCSHAKSESEPFSLWLFYSLLILQKG